MADGHASPVTEFWLARLDRTIGTEQPRTVKQSNADFNRTALGFERIGVGSGLVVIFVLFFADRRERGSVQAMLMVSVTTMLGAGLVMIKFFEDPYQNVPGSIRPEAMARTLATLESTRGEEGTRAPCGPDGLPLRRPS